jgi:preprotein translocase subunit YajC
MSFFTTLLPAADKPAASGDFFSQNFLTIALVAVLAIMVIFMVRNSRKRKRDAEELQNKFVPGAEVMTQHGIYGTLISVDQEKNEAIIETTPGTRLRVHRQTVARVIEPQDIAPEEDVVPDEPAPTGEPEYGERIEADEKPRSSSRKKPAADGDAAE